MLQKQNKVQWVFNSHSNAELAEKYDEWAKDYDHDLLEDFGYQGPQSAAVTFAKHVPKMAKILDAGAGTGLVGRELSKLGYVDMEAMDFSRGMLDEARRKNVYGKLHEMVMGEHLDFPTNYFDATISVGTLTAGHAPANSLDELVRVTKSGGHIVFTLRPDVLIENGFALGKSRTPWRLQANGNWLKSVRPTKCCQKENPTWIIRSGFIRSTRPIYGSE